MIKSIEVRQPKVPSAEEQISQMRWILGLLDAETEEPLDELVRQAMNWLENIQSMIPNHEEFVASSFSHFFPACQELLKGVGRKSAKVVLSCIAFHKGV